MSLRVGKTFCKGPRFAFNRRETTACDACVFNRGPHTCEKQDLTPLGKVVSSERKDEQQCSN
jgi:hypothetical protein